MECWQWLEGGLEPQFLADIICEQPLTHPSNSRLSTDYTRLPASTIGTLDFTLSDSHAGNPDYVQRAPAGHILFGFWSLNSDWQWKSLRDCLANSLTGGPSGNQTFLGTSLGQIYPDNPSNFSTVCPRSFGLLLLDGAFNFCIFISCYVSKWHILKFFL